MKVRAVDPDVKIAALEGNADGGETVANAILELASQLDLMGLALIFKLGAMPYDMVERSMTAFGEDVVPRIRPVLDCDATADFAATTPALHFA